MGQEPIRLFWSVADSQVRPAKERAGDGEAVADVIGGSPDHRQERSAIIVPQVREPAAIIGQEPGGEGQTRDRAFEYRGHGVARDTGNGPGEQIKVERV